MPYTEQNNENELRQSSFQSLSLNPDIFFETNRRLLKHCKQGNAALLEREWVPTYKQVVTKPSGINKNTFSANTDLMPQSLKDEDYNRRYNQFRPDNEQLVEYAPSQLFNVYFDGNDESYDDIVPQNYNQVGNGHQTEYGQKQFLDDIRRRNQRIDEETTETDNSSKQSSVKNDNNNENYKSQGDFQNDESSKLKVKSQSPAETAPKLIGSSISPKGTERSEKCITGKTSVDQENESSQSNRRLLTEDEDLSDNGVYNQDKLVKDLVDQDDDTNLALDKKINSQSVNLLTTENKRNDYDDDILNDPTKGSGILRLTEARMTLIKNSRVCYACSSAANPTCWLPDRRTTVKYCRKGHDSCVTKTFLAEGKSF